MGAMASQITSLTIVYSTVYSDPDESKHESSASLAFVRRIHRSPVNSPYKWPVTRMNVSIWWRHHVCLYSIVLNIISARWIPVTYTAHWNLKKMVEILQMSFQIEQLWDFELFLNYILIQI